MERLARWLVRFPLVVRAVRSRLAMLAVNLLFLLAFVAIGVAAEGSYEVFFSGAAAGAVVMLAIKDWRHAGEREAMKERVTTAVVALVELMLDEEAQLKKEAAHYRRLYLQKVNEFK